MSPEQLATWIVGLILGVIEVPVIQWLKEKLGLEDKAAFLLVMGVSIVIAFGALGFTGGFSPFDINRLFEYMASILALSQVVYALFLKK